MANQLHSVLENLALKKRLEVKIQIKLINTLPLGLIIIVPFFYSNRRNPSMF